MTTYPARTVLEAGIPAASKICQVFLHGILHLLLQYGYYFFQGASGAFDSHSVVFLLLGNHAQLPRQITAGGLFIPSGDYTNHKILY